LAHFEEVGLSDLNLLTGFYGLTQPVPSGEIHYSMVASILVTSLALLFILHKYTVTLLENETHAIETQSVSNLQTNQPTALTPRTLHLLIHHDRAALSVLKNQTILDSGIHTISKLSVVFCSRYERTPQTNL
jgi:hypothetical protein